MTDILVRNIAEATIAKIDELATRAGLSRAEYLRRTIENDAARAGAQASIDDLGKFELLEDEEHMKGAWS